MRSITFSVFFLFSLGEEGSCVSAQSFTRRYDVLGQQREQFGFSIECSGTDRYVVLGTTAVVATDGEYYNPVVATLLLDGDGNILAEDTLIYPLHESYAGGWNCMSPLKGGGFISAGWTQYIDIGTRSVLYALSDSGAVNVLAEFGDGSDQRYGAQAIECKNGDRLLIGGRTANGETDAEITRVDTSGNVLWEQLYGVPGQQDFIISGDTAQDDGFFVGGQRQLTATDRQFWVQRLNADGDTLWTRMWGGPFAEWYAQLSTKANGDPVIAGVWGGSDQYDPARCYMAELDAMAGGVVWERWYGQPTFGPRLYSVKETASGGHIAAGGMLEWDTPDPFFKGLLLRTADNGDSLWMRTYFYYDSLMFAGMGNFFDAIPTSDGGFIACGNTQHAHTGPDPYTSRDIWVVKVDSVGCIVPGCDLPMGVTAQVSNLAQALTVGPNPAHGHAILQLSLPPRFSNGDLDLTVVDVRGRMMSTRIIAPGETRLDITSLPSGLYYLHVCSGHTWLAGTKLVVE